MILNLIGFTAATISFIMWLPQARITWKHRNSPKELQGISKGTHCFVLVNATLWGIYAVMSESYWAGAPGLVNFPLSLITLILIHRAGKVSPARDVACGCGWEDGDHTFFVTSPPGFGTIRPCHGTNLHGFAVPAGTVYDRASNSLRFPGTLDKPELTPIAA